MENKLVSFNSISYFSFFSPTLTILWLLGGPAAQVQPKRPVAFHKVPTRLWKPE